MNASLIRRYHFFREHAGTIVGESARCALTLARAEERAEREELVYVWERELESHSVVFGEDNGEDALIASGKLDCLGCCVYASETEDPDQLHPLASLGMITIQAPAFTYGQPRDPYIRVVQAELAVEALERLDALRREWAADVEASRPDLYNGGEARL